MGKEKCLKDFGRVLNKLSDLSIEVDFKKIGQKVTHLKFKTVNNQNLDFEKQLSPIPRQEKQVIELKVSKDMLSFGVSTEIINQWSQNYTEEYLQSKLDLVVDKLKQGKIKSSPTGFLIKAVEDNYGDAQESVDKILEQEALEARRKIPETVLVDPTAFTSEKEFKANVITLEAQYYSPRWLSSLLEVATKKWNTQVQVA